jgi:hypothetical protein
MEQMSGWSTSGSLHSWCSPDFFPLSPFLPNFQKECFGVRIELQIKLIGVCDGTRKFFADSIFDNVVSSFFCVPQLQCLQSAAQTM